MNQLYLNKFRGVTTALITPFKNGKVDFKSFSNLLDFQINSGITRFVVNGTTGESPNLLPEEVRDLYEETRRKVGTHGTVILGTGSNSTVKTIQNCQRAEKLGADGLLVVVPYYNKPPQRGLFEHFKEAAESVSSPIILYNVPGRTVTSLSLETIIRLSQIKNIIGIKEASGDKSLAQSILKSCHQDFLFLSGDDMSYVDFLQLGIHGIISVSSHIIPTQMIGWMKSSFEGRFDQAKEDSKKYMNIIELLFLEANPIPIKKALQMMGLIDSAELRLPLMECEEKLSLEMKKMMIDAGIII